MKEIEKRNSNSNNLEGDIESHTQVRNKNDPYIIKLRTQTGHKLLTFIDSGSQLSTLKMSVGLELIRTGQYKTRAGKCTATCASGNKIEMNRQILLVFKISSYVFRHWVWLTDSASYPGAMLAGLDFIKHVNMQINPADERCPIKIGWQKFPLISLSKAPDTMQLIVNDKKKQNESVKSDNFKVRIIGKQSIKANSICHLRCDIEIIGNSDMHKNKNFVMQPCIPIESGIRIPSAVINNNKQNFYVPCFNFNDKNIDFPNSAIIASAEIVEVQDIDKQIDNSPEIYPEDFNKQLQELDLSHLNGDQKEKILQVLRKHKEAFSTKEHPLGKVDCVVARIPTDPPDKVVYTPQYRIPHALRSELDKIIQDLLKQDVITECVSPFNSPILMVKKPNGSWRFAQDCRNLNKILVKQVFPLPRISETLEQLNGSNYFSTLDAKSGFHQIPVAPEDRPKLAFTTQNGRFTFKRLCFGLRNSSYIFQEAINIILKDVLGKTSLCYIDDIITFSKTFEQHLENLAQTFQLLIKGGLRLSLNKCTFAKKKLLFLGYQVSGEGIQPNPQKVEAIAKIPPPKNETEVRQIVAAAGFYRTLIPNFAEITAPLTELLKKEVPFNWTKKEQRSFEELKRSLTCQPVTVHPDFTKTFQVHSDASGRSIGACLMQENDSKVLQPISYFSRKLKGPELNYPTIEREALAIVAAIKQYHYYLYGRKFVVYTDHKPLTTIFQKNYSQNGRITRWAAFLSDYDFTVVYKQGKSNVVPDLLSRIPHESSPQFIRNSPLQASEVITPQNPTTPQNSTNATDNLENSAVKIENNLVNNANIAKHNVNNLNINGTEMPAQKECENSVNDNNLKINLSDSNLINNANMNNIVNKSEQNAKLQCSVSDIKCSSNALSENSKINTGQDSMDPLWKNFTKVNLVKEQNSDEFCKKICRYLNREDLVRPPLNRSLDEFCIDEDILYYIPIKPQEENKKITMKIVVPLSLIDEAMNIAHIGVTRSHTGFIKTLFKARELFYIPNMPKYVRDKCASCLLCARRKAGKTQHSTLGEYEEVNAPMDHINIDLLGPLPVSRLGNKYILSIVDRFSRFVTLYAIPCKETDCVARYFVQFILRNGISKNTSSDRGPEFLSDLMDRVCQIFGIEKHHTCAENPRANGLVETYNTSIMDILHFFMQGDCTTWDTHLNYIASALNSSLCTTTNNTSFYLFHGRDYSFPFSDVLQKARTFYDLDINYAREVQVRLHQTYEAVKRAVANKKFLVKEQYDKKARIYNFAPGSLVMLKNNSRRGEYPMPKMNVRFNGPFRILQNIKNRNLVIKDVFGKQKVQYVHSNRCKPFAPTLDCYPKFEEDITEKSEKKENRNLVKLPSTKIESGSRSNQNVSIDADDRTASAEQNTPTHGYNLRSRTHALTQSEVRLDRFQDAYLTCQCINKCNN